jgi:hypothetical protein
MKTWNCITDKDSYQPPMAEIVEIMPSQMVCGSNEDIIPGEETDW